MTDKELRKLSKSELLEILLIQSRKIEEQDARIKELEDQMNSLTIDIEESGTLAEAALRLSGIFDAAQKAADIYLENVKYNTKQKYKSMNERNLAKTLDNIGKMYE